MSDMIDQLKNIDNEKFRNELCKRQRLSWSDGRIEDYEKFPEIKKVFEVINELNKIGYKGDLYRIHFAQHVESDKANIEEDYIIRTDERNNDCYLIPKTDYNGKIVSFSKSYDFTDTKNYPKITPDLPYYNFIHINTSDMLGIDVMKAGGDKRYQNEQEVLFPLDKKYLVKEYKHITPIEFKKIMDEKHAK